MGKMAPMRPPPPTGELVSRGWIGRSPFAPPPPEGGLRGLWIANMEAAVLVACAVTALVVLCLALSGRL